MADLLNKARIDGTFKDEFDAWMQTELTVQMIDMTVTKTADHEIWLDGDLTYFIKTDNNDTEDALTGVTLTDTIEDDKVSFIGGSVKINDVETSNYNYTDGVLTVELPDIAPASSVTVSFRVEKL